MFPYKPDPIPDRIRNLFVENGLRDHVCIECGGKNSDHPFKVIHPDWCGTGVVVEMEINKKKKAVDELRDALLLRNDD